MSDRYRIGELSRLLGIPSTVFRFYETRGIVQPMKDWKNSYRYYSNQDACRLLNSKLYRSLGFSLEETERMMDSCTHGEIVAGFDDRIAAVDGEIERLRYLREKLVEYRADCTRLDAECDAFAPVDRDGMYRVPSGRKNRLSLDEAGAEIIQRWMEYLPFVYFCCLVPRDVLAGTAPFDYNWGMALAERDAARLGGAELLLRQGKSLLAPEGPVDYFPPCRCVHLVIEQEDDRNFTFDQFRPTLRRLDAAGLEIDGAGMGRLVEIARENKHLLYRFSFGIPVRDGAGA